MLLTTTAVWWFILSLTAVIILCRFAVLVAEKAKPYAADFFMLFTWFSTLVMVGMITSQNSNFLSLEKLNVHSKRQTASASGSLTSPAELEHIEHTIDWVMKMQYIIGLFNVIILWAAKATLFAVYVPVQSRLKNSIRILLAFGCLYTFCTFIITFFLTMFWCGRSLSANWTVDMMHPNTLCAGITAEPVVIFTTAATLTTDIILLIVGVLIVGSLKVTGRREVVALVFVFVLGLVSVIACCVRFAFVIDMARNSAKFSRWMAAETMTAVVVCCLPTARTLLRRLPGSLSFGSGKSGSTIRAGSDVPGSKGSKNHMEEVHGLKQARSTTTERSTDEERAGALETQAWRLQG